MWTSLKGTTCIAVASIHARYEERGLSCLEDAPRGGKPPTQTAATKQKIITTVCGNPPKGLSRWSAGTLAAKLGLPKCFVDSVLVE